MNVLKIIEQMKADFRVETGKEATDIYVGKSGMKTILHEVQANEDATSRLCGLTLHRTEDESCLGIGISVDHLKEKATSNKEWKPPTSPGDLAMRLEKGELFNDGGNKVWYDPSKPNPFRYNDKDLNYCWKFYAEMTQWVGPVHERTKPLFGWKFASPIENLTEPKE